MSQEQVTEFDLRREEFKDARLTPEMFEFDKDGNVVRKDRFETGMRQMHGILIEAGAMNSREPWTVDEVVQSMRGLIEALKLSGTTVIKGEQYNPIPQEDE